jgi:hypothetical protein
LFLNELKNNSIPQSLPNSDFPDWKSFNKFYQSKKNGLSAPAKQYCTELLLKSYDLTQYSSTEVKNIITESLALLSENNYAGYELLHKYLSWMKINNVEFKTIQSKVLSYAKPILGKPDPNLKDDPIFESNPTFKKNMEILIEKTKINDAFIVKIKSL